MMVLISFQSYVTPCVTRGGNDVLFSSPGLRLVTVGSIIYTVTHQVFTNMALKIVLSSFLDLIVFSYLTLYLRRR